MGNGCQNIQIGFWGIEQIPFGGKVGFERLEGMGIICKRIFIHLMARFNKPVYEGSQAFGAFSDCFVDMAHGSREQDGIRGGR